MERSPNSQHRPKAPKSRTAAPCAPQALGAGPLRSQRPTPQKCAKQRPADDNDDYNDDDDDDDDDNDDVADDDDDVDGGDDPREPRTLKRNGSIFRPRVWNMFSVRHGVCAADPGSRSWPPLFKLWGPHGCISSGS